MKNVIYTLLIIIITALQTTVFSGMRVFGASADLLLAFTIVISLCDGAVYGGVYGLICGIIIDTLMIGRFGFNALVFMYTGVLIGIFKEHFFRNNVVVAFLCSFLASFIHRLLHFLLIHYIRTGTGFWYNVVTKIPLGALLTAICTIIMYYIYSLIISKNEKKGIKRRYGF